MQRQTWERPRILATHALPDALGDCVDGATEIVGLGCVDGSVTGPGTGAGPHTCNTGNRPATPE